ncbi:MAG: PilZ domain-containing protein [Candidatus Omnitrophica bacterium]|nr:PilZ domain-containing protein [Candidatus Omnitrophota bacterium]
MFKWLIDRRMYVRMRAHDLARYRYEKAALETEKVSSIKDISAGGVLLITDEPIEEGTILELKINVPFKKEPLACRAKALRYKERKTATGIAYETGCLFLDITEKDKKDVVIFLDHVLKKVSLPKYILTKMRRKWRGLIGRKA